MTRSIAARNRRNKARGYELEREVVVTSREAGFESDRTWGSNGRSRGLHEEVDVVLVNPNNLGRAWHLQCKRKKALPKYIKPSDQVEAQVVRGDGEPPYIILPYQLFLDVLLRSDYELPDKEIEDEE